MKTRHYPWLAFLFLLLVLGGLSVGCSPADGGDDPATRDTSAETADPADDSAPEDSEIAEGDTPEGEGEADGEGEEEERKPHAVPVEVAALSRGAIESVLEYSATLEAERSVKVFSEASRLVRDLLVEEGDRVVRDQVLVRLQDEAQRNNLARASNELAQAEREYKRQERLYQDDLISEEAFNKATFELEQLRIALADSERELGYTEVKAPIAGTITQRLVNLGDQVSVGQHLFDIVDFDSLVARVFVPEKHLRELQPGLAARLSARAVGGSDYEVRVKRIAPIVDPRSGTVKVTIDVGRQVGLRPGMYVDVDLVTAKRDDALLLPKRALVYDDDQLFVFRLGDERRVERIFVEPRLADKFNIEPLAGFDEGDQIVIAGQAGLKDGALVRLPGDEEEEAETDEETSQAAAEDEPVERAS